MNKINRISIIGGSGTGKTTLSNNLAKELNLPAVHLDGINFFENWKERDKSERDKLIVEKTFEEKWIIDGTYTATLKERFDRADLVIYLDYSTLSQLKGIISRNIRLKNKERKEIPGCKDKIDIQFLLFVIKWRKNKRNKILEALNSCDKNKILIFKNRRQLNKWYKNKFNKRIVY